MGLRRIGLEMEEKYSSLHREGCLSGSLTKPVVKPISSGKSRARAEDV